ncbi:MAG TPA: hypothetical protein VGF76_19660 [Polyangiaceae bacterium]
MTDKREKISTDPGLGPLDPPGPSTLRSIEAAEDLSSISPNAPVYYEPAPLIAVSDHKTLELETVKLAENIDPRKLATEMRLGRVPSSLVPPSDSGWPPETALSTSQPPDGPGRRRWRAPLLLCALFGALMILGLARAAAHRTPTAVGASLATQSATAQAATQSAATQSAATQSATAQSATAQSAVGAPPQAAGALAPVLAGATAVTAVQVEDIPTATATAPAHNQHARSSPSNAPQRSAIPNSQPAREPLAAPSSSKPKRAIY